jgi:hypothetical protein
VVVVGLAIEPYPAFMDGGAALEADPFTVGIGLSKRADTQELFAVQVID